MNRVSQAMVRPLGRRDASPQTRTSAVAVHAPCGSPLKVRKPWPALGMTAGPGQAGDEAVDVGDAESAAERMHHRRQGVPQRMADTGLARRGPRTTHSAQNPLRPEDSWIHALVADVVLGSRSQLDQAGRAGRPAGPLYTLRRSSPAWRKPRDRHAGAVEGRSEQLQPRRSCLTRSAAGRRGTGRSEEHHDHR